ncbi:MAG: hypothetical protein FJ086_00740 [Deltaproteobacteria bacterium]|nr:hypothetical protein [Deltaproteobacteria bacterium]
MRPLPAPQQEVELAEVNAGGRDGAARAGGRRATPDEEKLLAGRGAGGGPLPRGAVGESVAVDFRTGARRRRAAAGRGWVPERIP